MSITSRKSYIKLSSKCTHMRQKIIKKPLRYLTVIDLFVNYEVISFLFKIKNISLIALSERSSRIGRRLNALRVVGKIISNFLFHWRRCMTSQQNPGNYDYSFLYPPILFQSTYIMYVQNSSKFPDSFSIVVSFRRDLIFRRQVVVLLDCRH